MLFQCNNSDLRAYVQYRQLEGDQACPISSPCGKDPLRGNEPFWLLSGISCSLDAFSRLTKSDLLFALDMPHTATEPAATRMLRSAAITKIHMRSGLLGGAELSGTRVGEASVPPGLGAAGVTVPQPSSSPPSSQSGCPSHRHSKGTQRARGAHRNRPEGQRGRVPAGGWNGRSEGPRGTPR